MASFPISLVVAYSFWKYFLGHQGSHLAYTIANGGGLNPTLFWLLVWYNRLSTVIGISFLVYLGYVSQWYVALALFGLGFVGQFLLVAVETRLRLQQHAWAISLAGLPTLPILLGYMIYVAANYQ
jgi:hypothetical protein